MASYRARVLKTLLKVSIRSVFQGDTVSLSRVRNRMASVDALFRKHPRGTIVTSVDADGVPADWVVAQGLAVDSENSGRVLLYIHGGGFSIRMPRLYAKFSADLGKRLKARVLLVDYRLAPEHPFPAGPNDCLTVYRWLLQQPGVEAGQVMIAGDSAGGNLTLVTMLMAKQAGLPLPAAAWAISPGVDCDWSHSSLEELQAIDPMFSTHALDIMGPYFGSSDRSDFRISPINGDLAGLPPLLLEAGGKEMFREHPAMMARQARAAGVKVKDRIWEGMPHVFQVFPYLPEAKRARRQACRFLRGHLSAPATRSSDSVLHSQVPAVIPGGLPGPAAKGPGEAAGVGEA